MSTGGSGTDGASPEYPAHMGAWASLYLGWTNSIRPTQDSLFVLQPIESGGPVVDFWFQGEPNPEHFLIENRQRTGFDRNLLNEGLIVYQLNETVIGSRLQSNGINRGPIPGVRLVEADGLGDLVAGRNRGDDRDPFPGSLGRTHIDDDTSQSTRTFLGAVTNTALRQIEALGDNMRFLAQVQAPGWLPATNVSGAGFNSVWPYGPAQRGIRTPDGVISLVTSELRAGHPQIMLRTRRQGLAWSPVEQVTNTPGSATDPTVAALPGGDLVLAWTDTRNGPTAIYYRSRIAGVWTPERRVTFLPGNATNPCIGADPRGRVHLTWLHTNGAMPPQIMFMSFTYFSPYGAPIAVTGSSQLPDVPALAVAPDGSSYVLWPDRTTTPVAVWYAHFHPDSGMSVRHRLVWGSESQVAIRGAVDAAGALHVLWQVSGAGLNELHYERLVPGLPFPSPQDTIVDSRGESIQDPTLKIDATGAVHITYTISVGGALEVRYKHWEPGRGWDLSSTRVTQEGSATRPALLPLGPRTVSIVYIGFPGGSTALMERRRELTPEVAVDVPEPAVELATQVRVGPNPLRPGVALALHWPADVGPEGGLVDFFDVSGRRVASAPLAAARGEAVGQLSGDVTRQWSSGVYFARLRGSPSPTARIVVLR
jgi:hypothetical protein